MANRKHRRSYHAHGYKHSSRRHSTRSHKGGRPWTSQEIAFMRKYYRTNETRWVARQIGRTVYSVRYKASSLNIRKSNPSVWKGNHGTPNSKTTRYTSKNYRTRWASGKHAYTRRSRTRTHSRSRRNW